jgi:chromosome segregation ATPase
MTVAMIDERTNNILRTLEHNCSANEKDHYELKKQLAKAKEDTDDRLDGHDEKLDDHERQINKWKGALTIIGGVVTFISALALWAFQKIFGRLTF